MFGDRVPFTAQKRKIFVNEKVLYIFYCIILDMFASLVEKLKNKMPHHVVVLFSSFAYIVSAIFLFGKDPTVISFLLLVFLTSLFYHSYPHNHYFRLADWLASLSFIYYLFNFIYKYDLLSTLSLQLLLILAIVSIVSWTVSFFAFIEGHNRAYNISHTIWHILGALIIYIIVFSF